MSMYGRGPVLARLHAAFEKPLRLRCVELEKILQEYSYKDLAGCLSIIVENIFGFGVADSSSGNWHIGRVVKSQSGDFSNLRYLLSPNGPLLQVIYQLSTDPACRYEFPISCLPYPTRTLIDAGVVPPFYQDKVQISPSGKPLDVVYLGAFEFYMFHFAYYLVNIESHRSSRMPAWNRPDDCLYPAVLEDYLKYFFPLDCSTPPANVTVSRASPTLPGTGAAQFMQSSPRSQNANQSPSGYSSLLSLFHDSHLPLATSSPVSRVVPTAADVGCADYETWLSEVMLQILVEFYLNQHASVDSNNSLLASHTTSMLSQTGNHIRMVRLLIKHLHYFVNTTQSRRVSYNRSVVMPQWDDFKRRVWPVFVQKKLYIFLRHNFDWWPLDAMFRLVLETWLSYIQPWRYCIDQRQGSFDGYMEQPVNDPNRGLGRDGKIEEKWRQFVVDNILFYTVICQSFLQRALRMDLSAGKNAFMLLRMSKVLALPGLANMLMEAENAIQDASFSERASQTSALRRSSQPLEFSGCRYVCNVAGSLTAQFAELEGSRFEYRPLFSLATERVVRQLLDLMETAAKNAAAAAMAASESSQISWMEWLFGSNVDYNTSKYYYYNDEGQDNGMGMRATGDYLEQAALNLSAIFQIDKQTSLLTHFANTRSCARKDSHVQPPDVDCVDGVQSLTDVGRSQMMNGLRRFEIEYEGDPDLQPIRSYECAFLVRLLFAVSCYVNNRFASQISRAYQREDFVGRLMTHILQPPSVGKSPMTPERLNCMSPSTRARMLHNRSKPHLSLRCFATYQAIGYLLALYVALYLWLDVGVLGYVLIVAAVVFIYLVLKTALSKPVSVAFYSPR